MKDRFLRLCLRAYPRERRRADGEAILDVARELAADNGAVREGVALVNAGLHERIGRLLAGRSSGPLPTVLGLVFGVSLIVASFLTGGSWLLGILAYGVILGWIVTAIAERRRRRAERGPYTPAE